MVVDVVELVGVDVVVVVVEVEVVVVVVEVVEVVVVLEVVVVVEDVVVLAVVVARNVVCSHKVLPELRRLGCLKQQVQSRWNLMTWLGRWQDG